MHENIRAFDALESRIAELERRVRELEHDQVSLEITLNKKQDEPPEETPWLFPREL
jgi:hypothetical protein